MLLLYCDMDPDNIVLLSMVCNTHLYKSSWSFVGKNCERVGLRHVVTPLCIVITTVHFACSRDTIKQAAKVWGSIGVVLHE
jgi:hypothetical protein